jgi:hypothetical protein
MSNRLDTRIDTSDTTLGEHLLDCLVVVFAAKDHFLAPLEGVTAIVAASSPASIRSAYSANFSAVIVLRTVFPMETFCDKVTARSSSNTSVEERTGYG